MLLVPDADAAQPGTAAPEQRRLCGCEESRNPHLHLSLGKYIYTKEEATIESRVGVTAQHSTAQHSTAQKPRRRCKAAGNDYKDGTTSLQLQQERRFHRRRSQTAAIRTGALHHSRT